MPAVEETRDRATTLSVLSQIGRRMVLQAALRRPVIIGSIVEGAGVVFGITGPFFLKALIDALTANDRLTVLLTYVALFVLTWSGGTVLSTLRSVYSTEVVDLIGEDLAASVVQNQLPETVRSRQGDSGQTLGQLERLPFSLLVVVDGLIWRIVPTLVQIAGSLWLVCSVIPYRYALILAATLGGYTLATWLGARSHRRRSLEAHGAIGRLSRETGDVVRNARRVVLNGNVDLEVGTLRQAFGHKVSADRRMMWSLVWMTTLQYGVVGAGLVALLGLGATDVVRGHMTIGDFVLLQAYALRLATPLSSIGFVLSQTAVSIANIADVLNLVRPIEDGGMSKDPCHGPARIQLRDVRFSYQKDQPVLRGISAEIEAGSFSVIVGPNGSGKSTLAQVIAGVFDPDVGVVRVNGHDMEHIHRGDRHRHVLYVPQFIGVFNRTLEANGLYPPTKQTADGLKAQLERWKFYEPGTNVDGKTMVGEQGERLSGGQLQKLELARLLGIEVPVVVLDESTSALDPGSEGNVLDALRMAMEERTTIVMVSHRDQTAALADQVLFIREGRLIVSGQHRDLMAEHASYAEFWRKASSSDL